MSSFETSISRKLPLVSLISAIFIIYTKYCVDTLGVEFSEQVRVLWVLCVFHVSFSIFLDVHLSVASL